MISEKRTAVRWSTLLLLACSLVGAAALASCGDEVSFNAASEAPKAGTSYTALQYDYDTTGKIRLHFPDTVRITVDPTLSSFELKGDVVPFVTLSDIPNLPGTVRDTIHMHYEPNGDITALYRGRVVTAPGSRSLEIPDTWLVYPFGSKVNVTQDLLDTSYTYGTPGSEWTASVKMTAEQEFIGPSLIATEQGDLFVVGVRSEQKLTVLDDNRRTQVVRVVTAYYSPKLGGVAQVDIMDLSDIGSGLIERSHVGWQITSYSPPPVR